MANKPKAQSSPNSDNCAIDGDTILNAISASILTVDHDNLIIYANLATELLFQISLPHLIGKNLNQFIPEDSPAFSLLHQVRKHGHPVSEYEVVLETPRIGKHMINLQAAPLLENPGTVIMTLQIRTLTDKIDRQLTHRGAARSVTAMASMLAHEIKNPLSGIRGAAQLLEESVDENDKPLACLIRDESDRICDLVDRMDIFSDGGPVQFEAVNIHLILDRVHQLARNGFAKRIKILTEFDPSLPPVYGNRDQLIQVFLNLLKNAAEACPDQGGEILMETTYQHGVRFVLSGRKSRVHVPLMVTISDNGPGVPDDIQNILFDPFVTSKPQGSGLGLALVAKIIGDHGGVIEYDHDDRKNRTAFKVMLPIVDSKSKALRKQD